MNLIPDSKVETLRQAFLSGESVRGAMHQAGVAKLTVEKFYREFRESGMQQPLCACGRESGHKGWCSHRYSKSEARQTFMEHWGKPKQNGNEMPLSDGIVGECRTDPPRDLMKDGIWLVPEHERPPGWERLCSTTSKDFLPVQSMEAVVKDSLTTQLSEEIGQLTVAPTGGENASIRIDPEDKPIACNDDTAAVNGANRRCEAEGPTPPAPVCKCGKPAKHRGRCKGAGFGGLTVREQREVDKLKPKPPKPGPKWKWLFDRLAAGEDKFKVDVPAGLTLDAYRNQMRSILSHSNATKMLKFNVNRDGEALIISRNGTWHGELGTSHFSPSNDEPKQEVFLPIEMETKDSTPPYDDEPLRTSKDAEKHLLELSVEYWTGNWPDGDNTPDYLCERMAELADEVKVRREIEKAIDVAGAWAYDPDNPSTDPLGDWERAAASIAYQQRVAGRTEERAKLTAKSNISR